MTEINPAFLERAIELSAQGAEEKKGGPFGCVVVKDGKIIGEGCNEVLATNDPTAHAEVVAIRNACKTIGSFQLTDCDVYTSCEPCPMCLGAIYWARPRRVIFANTQNDAAAINFDDHFIYTEIETPSDQRRIPFIHVPNKRARDIFSEWERKGDKQLY